MISWRREDNRRSHDSERQRGRRLRGFWWTVLAGLIMGVIGFGQPLEDTLRVSRNHLHPNKASGDIILVAIDDRSLELHTWPWPRGHFGKLIDQLSDAGARRVFLSLTFLAPTSPSEDQALARSVARSRAPVTFATSTLDSGPSGRPVDLLPLASLRKGAGLASTSFDYDYRNAVWSLPYAALSGGRSFPSFASALAETSNVGDANFPIDYSIDPGTIPSVSAIDVHSGRVAKHMLAGKDVIIGTTSAQVNDQFLIPGRRRMGGVYVHVLGAETLKAGNPVSFGWMPAFVVGVIVAAAALQMRRAGLAIASFAVATSTLLVVPILTEHNLIYFDVVPGLFVLLTTGGTLAWSRLRQRAVVNAVSGLPNLNALRLAQGKDEQALVAARVLNYAEIVSSLPPEAERAFVGHVTARLKIGAPEREIYHGDDGLFVWFVNGGSVGEGHLDALCALFRSPVVVAGASLDVAISFGIDDERTRSVSNRLGSAIVAAEEAATEGLKWKVHDPATLKDAAWKLSLLGQLDAAIETGELWVAYQPKLDIRSGRICGAEALVRWTHPAKGAISPLEFIPAAEQHDRIERLTWFVMDRALKAASVLNRRGYPFGMAVNLSGRLFKDPGLSNIVAELLERHGVPPELLTIEITETAALGNGELCFELLRKLRVLGVAISIDDYGTGQSTLEYLKKVPATEIKVDQSFVRAVGRSRSDHLVVSSTIQLAHSLGQRVVAEGIEDEETLALLTQMDCDVAQGFLIGRPMTFRALTKRLLASGQDEAA